MKNHLSENLNIPDASIKYLKEEKYTIVTTWDDRDIDNTLTAQLRRGNVSEIDLTKKSKK